MHSRRLIDLYAQIADRIDYAVTSARLAILDRLAGPMPKTWADNIRERERERLQKAFPEVDVDGTGPLDSR
jgi:hypothetical protein